MRYYKLIDPVDIPVNLYLPHTVNGVPKYESFRLLPGKKYEEFIEDKMFMDALLSATKDIPYTPERKALLDNYGARYEEKVCTPCQGRVKKLRVWFAEVVE